MTIDDVLIDGALTAIFATVHATHEHDFFGLAGTHRRVELTSARYMTLNDGLITRERRVYDFTGLLVQLGCYAPSLSSHSLLWRGALSAAFRARDVHLLATPSPRYSGLSDRIITGAGRSGQAADRHCR